MIYSTNLPIAIMKDVLGVTYPLNFRIVKIENNKLFLEMPMFIPVDEMK